MHFDLRVTDFFIIPWRLGQQQLFDDRNDRFRFLQGREAQGLEIGTDVMGALHLLLDGLDAVCVDVELTLHGQCTVGERLECLD